MININIVPPISFLSPSRGDVPVYVTGAESRTIKAVAIDAPPGSSISQSFNHLLAYIDTLGTMSASSQDLPRTPLPLTLQHRDEIDQTVLKRVRPSYLKTILEDEGANDAAIELIMTGTIWATSELLRRENLKDNLDVGVAWAEGTLQQRPELRGIIRHACQTRSFSHIADLDIFQIPQASDPPAPSAEDEDQSDFLYNSFVRPYVGKAVDGFYEYLKNNNMKFAGSGDKGPYYAKFCSIVQS
ncbi:uncharacterized protein EDB93DRAFT_1330667, partial [Suillus bovinus]|uniref:uncharacterized protein n=1 Tax=Suillus bovinus TaxID=48563 RepID=UPI001B880055